MRHIATSDGRRLAAAALLLSCSPLEPERITTSSDAATGTGSTSSSTTTTDGGTTASSSSPDDESATDADTNDGGVTFIIDDDVGPSECDLFAQDCPRGEKCMPWASDGGNAWNASRCSPIARRPRDLYETCTVEDHPYSGIDDCKLGAMCFFVDPETNVGECIGFCMGSEANPTCEDPEAQCIIQAEAALLPCLAACNPLLDDCDAEKACVPVSGTFACWPDGSGDAGAYGDPCEIVNGCDPLLFCAVPDGVPDCQGPNGCCSPFCDTSDPEASAACPGVSEGQECVAWFEEGQAPSGYEVLGACLIPA